MSYSCYISFKQMEPEHIIPFFKTLKQFTTSQLKNIAQDNYNYCPYIRGNFNTTSAPMSHSEWQALSEEERNGLFPRDFENVSDEQKQKARRWARDVFQYRYAYDAERRLLCVFGLPDATTSLFDGTVYFQNSCDQNYPEGEWAGIKPLEDIYHKWMSKPDAEVLKWYAQQYGATLYDEMKAEGVSQDKFEQKFAQRMEYTRKSAAYDEIWANYEPMLYDDENSVYLSLYNQMDIMPITTFLRACHEAEIASRDENDKEYFETLCGKHPNKQQWIERMTGRPMDKPALMQEFMKTHPGYLEKFPELRDMYDEAMNAPDTPSTDDIDK